MLLNHLGDLIKMHSDSQAGAWDYVLHISSQIMMWLQLRDHIWGNKGLQVLLFPWHHWISQRWHYFIIFTVPWILNPEVHFAGISDLENLVVLLVYDMNERSSHTEQVTHASFKRKKRISKNWQYVADFMILNFDTNLMKKIQNNLQITRLSFMVFLWNWEETDIYFGSKTTTFSCATRKSI